MNSLPFQRSNLTYCIPVTNTTSTPVQLLDGITAGATQRNVTSVRIYNSGTVDVAIVLTESSALAVAVLPTAGSPQTSLVSPGGSIEIFSAPPDCWIAAICATGSANLYCTPGFGL